jgi:hypothetical protein
MFFGAIKPGATLIGAPGLFWGGGWICNIITVNYNDEALIFKNLGYKDFGNKPWNENLANEVLIYCICA